LRTRRTGSPASETIRCAADGISIRRSLERINMDSLSAVRVLNSRRQTEFVSGFCFVLFCFVFFCGEISERLQSVEVSWKTSKNVFRFSRSRKRPTVTSFRFGTAVVFYPVPVPVTFYRRQQRLRDVDMMSKNTTTETQWQTSNGFWWSRRNREFSMLAERAFINCLDAIVG